MNRRTPSWGSDWRGALEETLGTGIKRVTPVAGGDIGESQRVEFAGGECVFLKHYASLTHYASHAPGPTPGETTAPSAGLARAEASGLAWLAEADAIRIAAPIAWDEDWLALEWIESAPPAADYDELLGEGLAKLHGVTPSAFGYAEANWIGRLPQDNRTEQSWAAFYREKRLRPLFDRARRDGGITASLDARFARLDRELESLVGPDEPPARLHGDLWSGNVLPDEAGRPCLIDPPVYGGHREMDLAMMQLFGGFSQRVFRRYAEVAPLAAGAEERVALYQVYPLLVHVCLFGGGYLGQLERAVETALRGN